MADLCQTPIAAIQPGTSRTRPRVHPFGTPKRLSGASLRLCRSHYVRPRGNCPAPAEMHPHSLSRSTASNLGYPLVFSVALFILLIYNMLYMRNVWISVKIDWIRSVSIWRSSCGGGAMRDDESEFLLQRCNSAVRSNDDARATAAEE